MMYPTPHVYKLRVDGELKRIGTPNFAEAGSLAEPLLAAGRKVDIVDITTGKVINA